MLESIIEPEVCTIVRVLGPARNVDALRKKILLSKLKLGLFKGRLVISMVSSLARFRSNTYFLVLGQAIM